MIEQGQDLMALAVAMIIRAQGETAASPLELAAAFRIAAVACDEMVATTERAAMIAKLRGWAP